jgi:hypothetical protein
MAITNNYLGFTIATTTELNKTDNDSDFGASQNRNLATINSNYNYSAGIKNTFIDGFINQYGSSANFSTNEQRLVQNLIRESINTNGITVRYMPRFSPYTDRVFNERPESTFHKGLQIDMMLVATSGFEGEGDVMTTYGVEFREEVILTVAINNWSNKYSDYDSDLSDSDSSMYNRTRPLEGDIIVVPFGRSAQNKNQYMPKVFEITRTTTYHDGAFFQVGDNYQYKLRCKLFELSGEDLGFSPTAVSYNTTTGEQIGTTTEKIQRAATGIQFTDSDTRAINIVKDSDSISDSYGTNRDIEIRAQQKTIYDDKGKIQSKDAVIVEDYGKTAHNGPGIINPIDLDDI